MNTKIKIALTFLLPLTVALVGCKKEDVPYGTGQRGGGGNNANPSADGGSIGNGMQKFTSQSMDVSFDVPKGWTVEGHDKKFFLSNVPSAKTEEITKISFSISPEVEGERFADAVDLQRYLVKRFPAAKWFAVELGNRRKGFWQEEMKGKRRVATYYVLDENRNVMQVQVDAVPEFGGEEVARKVLNSMTIDGEGPKIKKVYFSHRVAKAGEIVQLVFEAEDELTGLDPQASDSTKSYGYFAWDIPRFGYRSTPKMPRPSSGEIALSGAYRFHAEKFRQLSATKFVYDWKVPKNAPPGVVQLDFIRLYDRKGNSTNLTCDYQEKTANVVDAACTNDLPQPYIRIDAGDALDYDADYKAPEIKEIYFDRSFVKGETKQRLLIRVTDETEVARHFNLHLRAKQRRGSDNNISCAKPKSNQLTPVNAELFAIELDTSECFRRVPIPNTFTWGYTPTTDLIYVVSLALFDGVGNPTEQRAEPEGGARLPQTRFELTE